MSDIILKTYELIDELDNSDLIKNLVSNKEKLMGDKKTLSLIEKYNKSDDKDKLLIKKELYQVDDYKKYMESYSELSLIVMRINKKFKEFTSSRVCFR